MRNMRKYMASSFCAILLSVSAIAAPINVESYAVAVPNTLPLSQDDNSEVTRNDFVAAEPYVVDLAVATPVPIKQAAGLAQYTLGTEVANTAVVQNGNFES